MAPYLQVLGQLKQFLRVHTGRICSNLEGKKQTSVKTEQPHNLRQGLTLDQGIILINGISTRTHKHARARAHTRPVLHGEILMGILN